MYSETTHRPVSKTCFFYDIWSLKTGLIYLDNEELWNFNVGLQKRVVSHEMCLKTVLIYIDNEELWHFSVGLQKMIDGLSYHFFQEKFDCEREDTLTNICHFKISYGIDS